ncbi:hypothetical protein EVA_08699 [gut metagenome]|uniref:Uncharacterized protein n=1 Tax=gut metagenome TaxID=749906 RepID=J9G8K6_9ZZZZ
MAIGSVYVTRICLRDFSSAFPPPYFSPSLTLYFTLSFLNIFSSVFSPLSFLSSISSVSLRISLRLSLFLSSTSFPLHPLQRLSYRIPQRIASTYIPAVRSPTPPGWRAHYEEKSPCTLTTKCTGILCLGMAASANCSIRIRFALDDKIRFAFVSRTIRIRFTFD